jgi:hypothetical protein
MLAEWKVIVIYSYESAVEFSILALLLIFIFRYQAV